ncbi:hypothetical protein IDG63_14430, partial [Staphylococcus sp. EG-SA-14]|nr:hypothetical protein [Staphylococcus sp. EG-SA-14]
FGYGISKLPYLLYPFVKITDAYVNPEMGWTLVIVFILGLLLLHPCLMHSTHERYYLQNDLDR